jgi:hypothetical protein
LKFRHFKYKGEEKRREEKTRQDKTRPLLGLLDSEDEGITILRNVGNC